MNALRAFEAAARHESFAKAAAELCVSHSVVSQHVRNLEQWLRTSLFVRHGNRVRLTEAGRMLAPRIGEAFQTITDACDALRPSPQITTLDVSAEPAFASRWLRRRMAGFRSAHPNIDIDLKSAWSPPDPRDGTTDVVIHFEGRLQPRGLAQQRLFPIDAYPACAPAFLSGLSKPYEEADIRDLTLIHDNGRAIWRQWFDGYAPGSDAWLRGNVYSDLALAIDAAVDGEGVILADDIICMNEIASGVLVKLDERALRCAWYCVAVDAERPSNPALDAFRCWLLETASHPQDRGPSPSP